MPPKGRKMHQEFKHPELREGEVFLTNGSISEFYPHIGWTTKRIGVTAYDSDKQPIHSHDFRPVFVQRSELEKAGITIDGEYNVRQF